MKRIYPALALLVLAACAGRRDPAPAGEERPAVLSAGTAPPPVYALLGYRDRLALSSAQVNALDSIGAWLDTANRPLLAQLGELRDGDRSRRRPGGAGSARPGDRAWPILLRLAENNGAAATRVRAVLSAEQRERVCELFALLHERRAPRGGRSAPSLARQTGPGAPGGAAYGFREGRGPAWPWCTKPPEGGGSGA
ncbi:MAG TPA: hypothetical protein VF746_28820 [Longimicrobium sp.]|jgi:hypothetical protein